MYSTAGLLKLGEEEIYCWCTQDGERRYAACVLKLGE
jgi:hypothetical protein